MHLGFQGFGLGYHLGYGYGGNALGVGAGGGYPYYGGPGYPHPGPRLQRLGGIAPFCYFGGPGYPTPEHPNFFGGVGGPLVPDQPVVRFESDPNDPAYAGDYGQFNGSVPYPESAFAPYTTMLGEGRPVGGVSTVSPPSAPPIPSTAVGRNLGFDTETFDNPGRRTLLRINIVVPGGLAEKAGLRVDDLISSINGYYTQKSSDLEWIAEHAASDKVLKLKVRTKGEDNEREVTIVLN